ncbi:MAG: hypothetical protein K8F62_10920, partial [Pseudorhodoplanes sp.]|nr:hypothetical protein [Pseudorhodoplanes sp.]
KNSWLRVGDQRGSPKTSQSTMESPIAREVQRKPSNLVAHFARRRSSCDREFGFMPFCGSILAGS